MTNITDLVYIDSAGFHYADYPTFLTWLQDQYKAIYGTGVYLEADSQDGQWIAINARAHYDSAALAAAVYNSFAPGTAQGVGLSSVVKINGIKRQIPTYSTADLTIVGQVGTQILNGVAQDTLGQKWNIPASVFIPISGSIIVTATAQDVGVIAAVAGTITKIYSPTLGWQSVTNVLAATIGAPVETDAELRIRQQTSVALSSLSVFEGTRGAVENVIGVTRVQAYENDSGVVDANGIPAHSIAIVAEGGDAMAIAQAIAVHKTPGTTTVGTTSEIVYDKYGMPNTINFYRPTIVPIKVEVDITAYIGYTTGYDSLIQAAVAAYINALKIGDDVLITKLYVPANLPGALPGTTFDIITIKIAKVANAFGTINVPILYNEASSCLESDVSIVVVP
jgi:uncharacterized phage protein gp47/JayE